MSLINQMLQDLEKRRPKGERDTLSAAQVSAVPRRRRPSVLWLALVLLVPAAGALAWLLLRAPAPEKPAPVPLPPVQAAAPAAPTEAAAEQPPAPFPADALIGELKVSTDLMKLPDLREPLAAKPEPRRAEATPHGVVLPASEAKPKLAPAAKPAELAAPTPATVAKLVKELTPQQRADSEYRKSATLLQQGRVQEAIDGLGLALQFDPRNTAARQALIGLLVEARRYGEAERRLQDGLVLDLAQPELAMSLARLQVERGDANAGLVTLERTLPFAAERPAYHAFLAALLQRAERHREAIDHYLQATRRAPQSGVWLMGLGISLQAENRLQEARDAFTQARASNSLSPELQAFVEQRLKQLGH